MLCTYMYMCRLNGQSLMRITLSTKTGEYYKVFIIIYGVWVHLLCKRENANGQTDSFSTLLNFCVVFVCNEHSACRSLFS